MIYMSNPINSNTPSDKVNSCNPARLYSDAFIIQPRMNDEEIEQAALVLKAIAHPVRLKIIDLIDQGEGEVCSCEIERFFSLSQPTISHHLKVLQEAGLITSESRGVWVYHKIRSETFALLKTHLSHFSFSK
jgi:ArsR family transcriptional regulator, arsenate/arsenite/antimonite-responsive transcriptional repressor